MLLASSRQKPIHGALNVSPKFNAARRKGSDLTLIELSGALEGSRLAVHGSRFTVHGSLFAVRCSLFAVCSSRLRHCFSFSGFRQAHGAAGSMGPM
jgi:hypothetical protein